MRRAKSFLNRWWKKWWKVIILSAVSTVSLYLGWRFVPDVNFLERYGLVGVFLGALITNLTIFLPISAAGFAMELTETSAFFVVVAAYTLGAVIGESAGYWVARLGVLRNNSRMKIPEHEHKRMAGWFKRYRWLAILAGSAFPLFPFDFLAFVAGEEKYPYPKFLVFLFIGRFIKYSIWFSGMIELFNHLPF